MSRDVNTWLHSLGMDRYLPVFEENEIDLAALPYLTEDDLKEIGVKLGARRQILAAISDMSTAMPPQDEADAELAGTVTDADRRQLTVMFVDLVGSTALSARLDPEDMRTTLQRYTDVVSDKIRGHGGYVANYLGDGVLAYFGWPTASEDQAEQAVRAALTSITAVSALTTPGGEVLSARAGIATGDVVVGDIKSDAGHQAGAVSGETPNLAARLQGEADPGEIVIESTTRSLIAGSFEIETLGARVLKGIPDEVEPYRVIREVSNESRFTARSEDRLTPLVGREAEFALLTERWRTACDGEGQVVLLSGEAGIGKSRTTQELINLVTRSSHVHLRYQGASHQSNTAFHPIVRQLEHAARFRPDDTVETKLKKLERTLAENVSASTEVMVLLASLLGLPLDGYPSLDLTPQLRKQRIISALAEQVEGLAARGPVLIVVEDAHWIDPTTLEAFSEVVERIQGMRVMLLVTSRPEFSAPWQAGGNVSILALTSLSRKQADQLVRKVAGGKAIPDVVVEQIMVRADGNPLFVEELTKTVVESGALRDAGDHYELRGTLQATVIPSTLQASLMARIDGLSNLKEVIQIAACIGREFSYDLLSEATSQSDVSLADALKRLMEAELIFRSGARANPTYVFKHALIQDSAHESLLRTRRQAIHGEIVKAMLHLDQQAYERQPEVLAYHLAEAGDLLQAVDRWLAAGRAAIATAANREAIGFMDEARVALEMLPSSEERASLELDTQILTAGAYIGSEGYSSEGTEEAYLRGRELMANLPVDRRHSAVIYGLFVVNNNRANHARSLEYATELRALAEDQNDPEMLCVAHRSLAVAYNPMGNFHRALEHSVKAVSFHDPVTHAESAFRYGHDIGVAALWHLALSRLCLGLTAAAESTRQQALSMSRELAHPTTIAYSMLWNGFFDLMQRSAVGALATAEEMYDFAGTRGMAVFAAHGRWMRAAARIIDGQDYAAAIAEIDAAVSDMDRVRSNLLRPSWMSFRAEACLANGDVRGATETAELGLKGCASTGEHWYLPELHRHFAATLDHPAEAEAELGKAITAARAQGSKLMELRAVVDLAKVTSDQEIARSELSGAIERLALDHSTPDAINANAALGQL